jgi:adenosylhomocysteine nucleosidase
VGAAIAGLVVALPEECRSLTARRMHRDECVELGAARLVCVAGVGGENAARAAHRLVEAGARGLVSWGCAAALAPKLKPGDLCLPAEILDRNAVRRGASRDWHQRAKDALRGAGNLYTETLLTTDRLVATAAEKRALAAACGAIAVDMESAAVAAVACEHGLPFLAVRAIADPADMVLPRAVMRATDAQGTVRRSVLLGHALLHPGEVGALWRLASQFRAALRTLARTADRMGVGVLLDNRGTTNMV